MSVNTEKFGRVGILMGGYSSEREISLKSGKAIFEALKTEGLNVIALDITENDEEKIAAQIKEANLDVAFIALHGRLGEDGAIQTILEKLNIPYPGSGPQASRIALNKILAQNLFKKNNMSVAPYVSLNKNKIFNLKDIADQLKSFPLVVKPACEGSSIGIKLVDDINELGVAVKAAFEFGDEVLIEKFIKGRELTVGILDEAPLPVIEIRAKNAFFDFSAKYQSGTTQYIIPARLDEKKTRVIQDMALKAHNVLGCLDFSRVDVMLSQEGTPYVLEVNTIPGFTSTSLLPKAAKEEGISFNQLCLKLLELAYGKKKEFKSISVSR